MGVGHSIVVRWISNQLLCRVIRQKVRGCRTALNVNCVSANFAVDSHTLLTHSTAPIQLPEESHQGIDFREIGDECKCLPGKRMALKLTARGPRYR